MLLIAAVLAVALLYALWSARPLWSDLALLAVLGWAVRRTWVGWESAAPKILRAPSIAFLAAYALAALFGPPASWRAVLGLVGYGLVFMLAGNLLAHGVDRRELYRALVLTAHVILAALLTRWLLDGAHLWGYRVLVENTNSLTLYSLLLMPALATGELRGLVLAEALLVGWLSAARSAGAGLVAGLLANRRGGWIALGLVAALLVAVLARADLFAHNGRLEMWRLAGRMFTESPLVGQGPNTFKSWWLGSGERYMSFGHAHNLYLNMAAEVGLVGLAAGAWLVAALVRALRSSAGIAEWRRAALAAIVALLVVSLGDVPTTQPYVTLTWLVVVRMGLGDEPAG